MRKGRGEREDGREEEQGERVRVCEGGGREREGRSLSCCLPIHTLLNCGERERLSSQAFLSFLFLFPSSPHPFSPLPLRLCLMQAAS